MSDAEMVSRAVTAIPEDVPALRRWLEKILRNHYRDLKRVYNREIVNDTVEVVPPDGEIGDDGNWRFKAVNGTLEIQKKISGTWTQIGVWSE